MNHNQHIPSGYKPSPLGIIPEDWEVKRIGDFAPLQRGFDLPTDKIVKGRYPVVYSNGILNYHNEFKAKAPGVVTGRSGTIGKVTFVESDYWPHNTSLWVTDFKNNNPKYVFHLYKYIDLSKFASGSGVPTLNRNDVHAAKIAVPPLPEQQRIVDVLELGDTAIAKQTALIEQLTLRKRGLMQQLLTGKKRLKGFEGEWKEVRLGDVASINRGGSPRPIEDYITDGEGYNWIKIGDVGVDAKYITSTEEKIIKEGLSKTRFVKSGDFILSNSMSFGRPYILKIDGCIHDGWLVIQEYSQTFNIDFLYYILGYDTTLAQYKSMAAGSGVLNLNKEIVKEVQLRIPSIDEQIVIASILVNADKEIEIQKQKLAAMQEEKKGLMQVLLTGKKRIK